MRNLKKLSILIIALLLIPTLIVVAQNMKKESKSSIVQNEVKVAQLAVKENQQEVQQSYTEADVLEMGFQKVSETSDLILYLNRTVINIVIYDKHADYYWFGYNPDKVKSTYTDRVKHWMSSGITIDYFDSDTLNVANLPITHTNAGSKFEYKLLANGFDVEIDLTKLGISFKLEVRIELDELTFNIPYQSIVEVPYKTAAMKFPKEYKLRSIYVFPYLGSENYEINGYAMIPDGSGALIRYTNTAYNTAYIKPIYGKDDGIQNTPSSQIHLKAEEEISMPVYGINHGYKQAAFISEISSGFGSSEIHSYPYKYNNIEMNTTFFVYNTRSISLIKLSGGEISSIPIINKDPYPNDYTVKYSFLNGDEADYSGMAKRYRENLELSKLEDVEMDMHLEILGLDKKPSLLGEQTVRLTTFKEAIDIVTDLYQDVKGISITYRSFNKGGIYGINPYKFSLSGSLGGAKDFNKLVQEIDNMDDVSLALYTSPIELYHTNVFTKTLKTVTLEPFQSSLKSSRQQSGSLLSITGLAKRILSNNKKYDKYDIDKLTIGYLGKESFSYQLDSKTYYRETMIHQVIDEVEKLGAYDLGLYKPASYLYNYVESYYDAPYQANSYAYITDSIPFISLVLSGSMKLYTPNLNYSSNLDLMKLKMIEYNLRPSFIVTSKEGYELRNTHHEYLLSTEYNVWESSIKDMYNEVSVLENINGQYMESHRYIDDQVAEVIYETHMIYVNYSDVDYVVNGKLVPAFGYLVTEVIK